MKKQNDKTNGIKTGNEQKDKYGFDGNKKNYRLKSGKVNSILLQ
jgi:hypothetical protein